MIMTSFLMIRAAAFVLVRGKNLRQIAKITVWHHTQISVILVSQTTLICVRGVSRRAAPDLKTARRRMRAFGKILQETFLFGKVKIHQRLSKWKDIFCLFFINIEQRPSSFTAYRFLWIGISNGNLGDYLIFLLFTCQIPQRFNKSKIAYGF